MQSPHGGKDCLHSKTFHHPYGKKCSTPHFVEFSAVFSNKSAYFGFNNGQNVSIATVMTAWRPTGVPSGRADLTRPPIAANDCTIVFPKLFQRLSEQLALPPAPHLLLRGGYILSSCWLGIKKIKGNSRHIICITGDARGRY